MRTKWREQQAKVRVHSLVQELKHLPGQPQKSGETGLFQCRLSRQQKQNGIHSKYTVEEGHSNPNGARTEHTAEGGCCIRTRKEGVKNGHRERQKPDQTEKWDAFHMNGRL